MSVHDDTPLFAYPIPDELARHRDRFWDKVNCAFSHFDCWHWTGTLNSEGRGRFTINGVTRYAYVWAMEYAGTTVPKGHLIRHTCGEPSCCNPFHLSAHGGQSANNADTAIHGRHKTAKLDVWVVRDIRQRHAANRTPVSVLADEYGVSASAISAVVTGKTWKKAGGPVRSSRKAG